MHQTDVDPTFKFVIGMGELQKVYKQRGISVLSEALLSLFMIAMSLLAVYYDWTLYKAAHGITGEVILFFLAVPFFMYIGISSFKKDTSRWNDSVAVYQNGFAHSHRNKVLSFQWTEITAIDAIAMNHRLYGIIPLGTSRDYWIETKETKFRLANTLDQVDDLLNEIRKNAFPHMYNRIKQELDSGKAVEFGLITIDKYGIRFGDKDYFWYDLLQAGAANGMVYYVPKKTSILTVSGIRVSVRSVTNIDVLLALSNDLIKQSN